MEGISYVASKFIFSLISTSNATSRPHVTKTLFIFHNIVSCACWKGNWPITNQHMQKMSVAKTTLRWMCGNTRKNRIRNECFREHLGVASIGDKIRDTHLRWFRNVQHNNTTEEKFFYAG